MTDPDESAVKEQLQMVLDTMTHSGQTETPEYFEKFDIEPDTARRLLAELAADDDIAVTRYPQDGDQPDEFGPPGADTLSERQVQDRVMRLVPDMDQSQPVSWFVEQGAGERYIVTDLLENLLNMDEIETYGKEDGETLLGPPGIDPSRTTLELLEPHPDEFQLGFPDAPSALMFTPSVTVGQTNAHQQYQRQFENTESFATPVTIGNRESLMDAMWEARGSAFKVVEERWKTFEKDGTMVSEPGQRRVRDREIDTLRKLYQLAWFIATDTFDADADPVLELGIQDYRTQIIDLREDDATEATTA